MFLVFEYLDKIKWEMSWEDFDIQIDPKLFNLTAHKICYDFHL